MRHTALLAILALAVVLAVTGPVAAQPAHYFDCKQCHTSGVSLLALGSTNVCLQCHSPTGNPVTLTDGTEGVLPTSHFVTNHASDAMGSATAAGMSPPPSLQSSHYWASIEDDVPAAGAQAPSRTLYYSRYGISSNKVTCGRCHEPHVDALTNPQLLRLDNSADALCLGCHVAWNKTANHGLETHPLVADYPTFQAANSDRYKPIVNAANGDIRLVGASVSCTSCHGTHWTDSNSATVDDTTQLSAGDGKLLRTDGRSVNPNTLCQTCHIYEQHGNVTHIGCLDCHSGHSYNDGIPNYYVLRDQVDLPFVPKLGGPGTVTGLLYTSADVGGTPNGDWFNAGNTGYCQGCHIVPVDGGGNHNGLAVGGSAECGTCHGHGTSGGSFTGSCNSCHGYAPSNGAVAGGPDGYAYADLTAEGKGIVDYNTDPLMKNESTTPHINHSDTLTTNSPNHGMACSECHDDFANSHKNGLFGDVVFGPTARTSTTTFAYSRAGNGQCSDLYCHSNGRRDGTAATRKYVTVAWGGARRVAPATQCTICHGNTDATMGAAARNNSSAHSKHLVKYGNDCAICHVDTATDNLTLKKVGGAVTSKHVDCQADVAFNDTFSLGAGQLGIGNDYLATGNCAAVYCHSNGAGGYPNPAPTWADVGEAAKCGACHQVGTADEAPALTIIGITLGGAHETHVFDTTGPLLACTTCHTNNGSGADHLNGAVTLKANYQSTVCNVCHGASDGVTSGADRQPVWANVTSVDCETCHTGSVIANFSLIAGPTAPDKSSATSTGHNLASGNYGVSNNLAAAQACTSCHSAAGVGHFDGISGDDKRLVGGFDCLTCHGSAGTATVKDITTHQAKSCVACHDPHGSSNIYMVRTASAGNFTGTVTFTATTGADSYDEDDNGDRVPGTTAGVEANADDVCATCHTAAGGTLHNNSDNSTTDHHQGTDCFACHKTHDDPGGAFAAGAGSSCDGCHGFPPATNAHVGHAPFSRALDLLGNVTLPVDRSACAYCHTGADLYTYDPSADRTSGVANRDHHGRGETTQDNTLLGSVGYNATNLNCTGACHASTAADGAWNDTALNCDACHGGLKTDAVTIASGKHTKHLAIAANDCDTCHGVIPTDTTHITDQSGATEILKVAGMAAAAPDEANVTVVTWNDTDNSCANAACHNPSGTTYLADWDLDTSSCALCHAGTSGDPGTGTHTAHRTSIEGYTAPIACVECHVDNGANMAHRDGTVDVPLDGPLATGGTATAVGTTWNGTSCSAVYCHDGALISSSGWSDAGNTPIPTWGANLLVGTTADCAQCHDNPPNPAKGHPNDPDCSSCHFNVVGTDDGFTDPSLHVNGSVVAEGGDKCIDCHSSLSATHDKHSDEVTILGVKTLSGGDYGNATWFYGYSSTAGGVPMAACGQCHPDTALTHKDGTVDLEFTSGNVNIPGGNIKLKNHATDTYAQTTGTSVTCSSVYCHSSGETAPTYRTAPDWFGGTFTGNKCDDCHGNDPGTGAHSVHEVGIHYRDLYNNAGGGELAASGAAGSGAAHGDPATSATLSCQSCHNSTVKVSYNDQKATCAACHSGGTAKGNMIIDATSTTHVNGQADVSFALTGFKSKAQVKGDITTVGELNGSWTRTSGYKAGATSHDAGKSTAPNFSGGSCSNITCHNGYSVDWTPPLGDCTKCHLDLP